MKTHGVHIYNTTTKIWSGNEGYDGIWSDQNLCEIPIWCCSITNRFFRSWWQARMQVLVCLRESNCGNEGWQLSNVKVWNHTEANYVLDKQNDVPVTASDGLFLYPANFSSDSCTKLMSMNVWLGIIMVSKIDGQVSLEWSNTTWKVWDKNAYSARNCSSLCKEHRQREIFPIFNQQERGNEQLVMISLKA